jgi:hypothetical protein
MNFQNATFNANGSINLDYEHPQFGWIPFTATENDVEQLGRDLFSAAQEIALPYVAPVESLPLKKLEKIVQVETARDAGRNDPQALVYTGEGEDQITWQVDPGSMAELNDAITLFTAMGGTPPGFVWRDANNTNHPAPLSLLVQIGAARAVQKQSIWNASWVLKAQVENATTIAALNSIVIPEKLS